MTAQLKLLPCPLSSRWPGLSLTCNTSSMETPSFASLIQEASILTAGDPQLIVDVSDSRDSMIEALDALALIPFSLAKACNCFRDWEDKKSTENFIAIFFDSNESRRNRDRPSLQYGICLQAPP